MHSFKNKNKERKRKETKGTWLDLEKALAQTRGPLVGILLGWDWIHSPKASRSLNLLQLIHSNVFIYKQLPIIANSSQKSAWSKDITKAPLSKWWQVTVSTKGTISRCSKGQGTRKVAIKPGAIVDHPQHFIGLFPPPFSEGFCWFAPHHGFPQASAASKAATHLGHQQGCIHAHDLRRPAMLDRIDCWSTTVIGIQRE